ncbi:MAG: UDP-N-acetylmuramoyl-L-alanine--D-glutamate ligase [Elusimicrobiota bacterium]|jgi:UDP-N-acetylmuramoylalanine--D-glutamate ligase
MSTDFKNRRVGVLGAGKSGLAAAALLKRLGADVLLSDQGKIAGEIPNGIAVEEGGHSSRLLETDLLIRSPGVPGHLPLLEKASQQGIPVWSEMELGYRQILPAGRQARYRELIAITGTNGKTTTTTLVGEFFKAARRHTLVGGNIGTPLSSLALRSTTQSVLVLEISSYQLENIETFHPTISAILNITPDHLEHHGTMRAYAAAKGRIFENQTSEDVCILNADDAWCRRLARRCRARVFLFSRQRTLSQGIYLDQGALVLRWKGRCTRWEFKTLLPGPHNIENILAAVAMAVAGNVPLSVIQRVLARFRGVEHRLERVRHLDGVRYINDSKGTNVDSTRVALASFSEPLVVIMGGRGKGSPYTPLKPLLKKRAKRILLIGEESTRIRRELGRTVPCEACGALPRAVRRARVLAAPGDVVLLSPACASFDQYRNYEERGKHFKALVRKLT